MSVSISQYNNTDKWTEVDNRTQLSVPSKECFTTKDIAHFRVKEQKKSQINATRKQTNSDSSTQKTKIQIKTSQRAKKRHYILIKRNIHPNDVTGLNIYTASTGALN